MSGDRKTLDQLIAGEAPLPPGAGAIVVSGLTADSCAVKPGFVFAALPGTTVDGARFIPQAIAAANTPVARCGAPSAHRRSAARISRLSFREDQ